MIPVVMDGYIRVTKTRARRLHDEGKSVYLQSCNFVPVNMWQDALEMPSETDMRDEAWDFDTYVRNYEFYNCTCAEQGYYAAYYIRTDEKDEPR
jgi:hypothetical protein